MKKLKGDPPERKCIVTGEVKPKAEMIRCVVDPEGTVIPDVDAKLPGRGMWVTATKEAMQTAVAKKLFSRAAKAQVKPMEGLVDAIEGLLVQRALALIGMMRRTNGVIFGFEKTRAWLKDGKCAVLIAARDGASDGRSKLRALAPALPLIELFDSEELAQAIGRDHVVHMGCAPGKLAQRFLAESLRLQGFREKSIE